MPEGDGEHFYKIAELASFLRVSRMTVYRLINSGELVALRVGRSYRISQADFDAYLESAGPAVS
jgi:excisionase family DNA binding protein